MLVADLDNPQDVNADHIDECSMVITLPQLQRKGCVSRCELAEIHALDSTWMCMSPNQCTNAWLVYKCIRAR